MPNAGACYGPPISRAMPMEEVQPSAAEVLADQTATTLPALARQVAALADLMRIQYRPEFDIERRLVIAIVRGIAHLSASSF